MPLFFIGTARFTHGTGTFPQKYFQFQLKFLKLLADIYTDSSACTLVHRHQGKEEKHASFQS